MTVYLNPYIGFKGNAREAAEFYQSVFGGELTLTTFGESHASQAPDEDNLVMHSALVTDSGLRLMMCDTPDRMPYQPGTNITISLVGDRVDETILTGYWDRLTVGANVTMPVSTASWGDSFGMCVDKFGIGWLLNIAAAS